MQIEFDCPACGRKQYYSTGEPTFRNCFSCGAKVIVPSTAVTQAMAKERQPGIGNFAAESAPDFGTPHQVDSSPFVRSEQIDIKLTAIQAEIDRGQKITAIKLYRELYGVGLKEAKQAVELMELGIDPPANPLPVQNLGTGIEQKPAQQNVGTVIFRRILSWAIMLGALYYFFGDRC
ncbi:MAG: ribosomal protein L7/L12 [Pyrinomonadaceae bacterium]